MTEPRSPAAALTGLRVLEFSDYEGIAYCGRTLAALGADVVKLEPTEGDDLRRRPPFATADGEQHSFAFEYLNAGKRSVALDLSSEVGRADAIALVTGADVVIATPEYRERLGLDSIPAPAGQLRMLPGGFGGRPAEGGPTTAFTRFHAAVTGYLIPGDKDMTVRPAWGGPYGFESMYGIAVAVAILAELSRGTGGEVDFSYQGYGIWMEKMMFQLVSLSETYDMHRDRYAYPFGGNHVCLDGHANIFVIEERQWHSFARLLGHDEWLEDPRFANGVRRLAVAAEIDQALAEWCAVRTVDDVVAAGRGVGVPMGRVRPPSEVLASPQLRTRGFVKDLDTVFGRLPAVTLPFGAKVPSADLGPAPKLGSQSARDAWSAASTAPTAQARPTASRVSPGDGLPLAGLRVLDFTWAAAGPIATSIMAFLGADVVKVEFRGRPDLMRAAQKQYGYAEDDDLDSSPSFQEIAAGKRSIELDLTDPADRATAFRLARVADVLIENMRPGKIEAIGLSYADVSAVNPGIVMCSQSATGRVGTAGIPGYAPIFWTEGGGAWLTGWPERRPGTARGPVDLHAAAYALLGILALLRQRAETGAGGYIDCAAIETVSSSFGPEMLSVAVTGVDPIRSGNAFPGTLLNDVFPCFGEDQWIAITIRDATEWAKFVSALDRPDLISVDPSTIAYTELASITAQRDASRLEGQLLDRAVPAARSISWRTATTDARFADRGIWQHLQHPRIGHQMIIGLPWTFDGKPYEMTTSAPDLGEHSAAVRSEWLSE